MDRNEARKAAEVMLAYADGKRVEVNKGDEWFSSDTVVFNWCDFRYRIKPQDTYRPFKDAEECWQEMQKHQPFGWIRWKDGSQHYQSLVVVEKNGVGCVIGKVPIGFRDSLNTLTFADGSVFGVKEE